MFSFKSHMRIVIDLMTAVDLDPCQQVIVLILPRLGWTRIKMSSISGKELTWGVDKGHVTKVWLSCDLVLLLNDSKTS